MKVESHYKGTDVILTLNTAGLEQEIYLDITTAIKLSKTIRTEINKVKEGSNV